MCCVPMGCINTKRDTCPTVFEVINVDDCDRHLKSGQLEVTDQHLVFYQRGKEPVRWPLKTIRRYGFDSDQFSFETGRKSPTGPGVYGFFCRRVEQLVNLLDTRLQALGRHDGADGTRRFTDRHSSISSGGPLSPNGSGNPIFDNLTVRIPRELSQNIYANDDVIATAVGLASTPAPVTQDETNNNLADAASEQTYANTLLGGGDGYDTIVTAHNYMNIVPGTNSTLSEYRAQPPPSRMVPWEEDEAIHSYANLDLERELDVVPRQAGALAPPTKVNYLVLDLQPGGDPPPSTSLPPDSPRKEPMGYATIDFDKTTALTQTVVDSAMDDSDCSRRTRHNSTICQMPRNSLTLSE